jgi:hypothetical protein
MGRIRLVCATLVAVALMSFGAAACSPEQTAQLNTQLQELPSALGTGIGEVITLWLWVAAHGPGSGYID